MYQNARQLTLLVTGGAGFVGSHLCEKLLAEGYNVICLDNFNDSYAPQIKEQNVAIASQHPRFTLIQGDILDTPLLHQIFSGTLRPGSHGKRKADSQSKIGDLPKQPPRRVIHLAALAGVRSSLLHPALYVDVDIKGTVNLLEIAREYKIEQFIFASSSSIYGSNTPVPFREEDDGLAHPISPYGTAKRAAELYCETYHYLYKIPMTILRFFTVYGPRQRPDMAIHKFVRQMRAGQSLTVYGNGRSERDYTYIEDCVAGIVAAMKNKHEFEIFNLGNSRTTKLKDLIELLTKKLGTKPRLKNLPTQPGDVPITYADISKAKRLLNYCPMTPIDIGLERFIEWFKQQKNKERKS